MVSVACAQSHFLFRKTCKRNSCINSSLMHVLMHSCEQSKTFLKKFGEPFAVVWERYKDLLHALPHHGLDVGKNCAYFHRGMSLNN